MGFYSGWPVQNEPKEGLNWLNQNQNYNNLEINLHIMSDELRENCPKNMILKLNPI